jgi:soluble lytic murein transglycosylase-like protein
MNLLFEEKVLKNKDAFVNRVIEIAGQLGIDPNWIMAIMNSETGGTFNPAITNSIGATGLIQFLPGTAKSLGTTTDELRAMSNVDQLYYVAAYLKPWAPKIKSYTDTYLAVFYPAALGNGIAFNFPDWVVKANPGIGKTVADFENFALRYIPTGWMDYLKKKQWV